LPPGRAVPGQQDLKLLYLVDRAGTRFSLRRDLPHSRRPAHAHSDVKLGFSSSPVQNADAQSIFPSLASGRSQSVSPQRPEEGKMLWPLGGKDMLGELGSRDEYNNYSYAHLNDHTNLVLSHPESPALSTLRSTVRFAPSREPEAAGKYHCALAKGRCRHQWRLVTCATFSI